MSYPENNSDLCGGCLNYKCRCADIFNRSYAKSNVKSVQHVEEAQTTQALFELVKGFFKGDTAKTLIWFATQTPGLGGIAPVAYLRVGCHDKLSKFIHSSLAENKSSDNK